MPIYKYPDLEQIGFPRGPAPFDKVPSDIELSCFCPLEIRNSALYGNPFKGNELENILFRAGCQRCFKVIELQKDIRRIIPERVLDKAKESINFCLERYLNHGRLLSHMDELNLYQILESTENKINRVVSLIKSGEIPFNFDSNLIFNYSVVNPRISIGKHEFPLQGSIDCIDFKNGIFFHFNSSEGDILTKIEDQRQLFLQQRLLNTLPDKVLKTLEPIEYLRLRQIFEGFIITPTGIENINKDPSKEIINNKDILIETFRGRPPTSKDIKIDVEFCKSRKCQWYYWGCLSNFFNQNLNAAARKTVRKIMYGLCQEDIWEDLPILISTIDPQKGLLAFWITGKINDISTRTDKNFFISISVDKAPYTDLVPGNKVKISYSGNVSIGDLIEAEIIDTRKNILCRLKNQFQLNKFDQGMVVLLQKRRFNLYRHRRRKLFYMTAPRASENSIMLANRIFGDDPHLIEPKISPLDQQLLKDGYDSETLRLSRLREKALRRLKIRKTYQTKFGEDIFEFR